MQEPQRLDASRSLARLREYFPLRITIGESGVPGSEEERRRGLTHVLAQLRPRIPFSLTKEQPTGGAAADQGVRPTKHPNPHHYYVAHSGAAAVTSLRSKGFFVYRAGTDTM